MKMAKIFCSGNSQAVRIPKEFQMKGDEVKILKKGESLVLRPRGKSWATLLESLEKFTDDFMGSGRKQPLPPVFWPDQKAVLENFRRSDVGWKQKFPKWRYPNDGAWSAK